MIIFKPHKEPITALAYSPDGTRLALVSEDSGIKVWDTAHLGTSGLVWEVEMVNIFGISHAQYHPTGKILYTCGQDWGPDGFVKAWNAADGTPQAQTKPESDSEDPEDPLEANAFTVSLCGKYLAYGGEPVTTEPCDFAIARTKDLATVRRSGNLDEAVGFLAAYEQGFISGTNHIINFWKWATPDCFGTISVRYEIRGLVIARDGSRVAVVQGKSIMIYSGIENIHTENRQDHEKLLELRGHSKPVNGIAFSPDGLKLASASQDGTLRIWDVATGSVIREFTPKLGTLHLATFSPDGLTIAFASKKGNVGVLDLDD